jgi:hypothetical protein
MRFEASLVLAVAPAPIRLTQRDPAFGRKWDQQRKGLMEQSTASLHSPATKKWRFQNRQ